MGNKAVAAFRALGDPVRLRLFYLLSRHGELCICRRAPFQGIWDCCGMPVWCPRGAMGNGYFTA